jgi:hypothetical protein
VSDFCRELDLVVASNLTEKLPTARTHLAAGWLVCLVWCKACHHRALLTCMPSSMPGRATALLRVCASAALGAAARSPTT